MTRCSSTATISRFAGRPGSEPTAWRRPLPTACFDRSFLAISVAASGLGIALESTRLAERELREGRLVAPLAGRAKDVRYVGHSLVYPRFLRQRQIVKLFAEWILRELNLDVADALKS